MLSISPEVWERFKNGESISDHELASLTVFLEPLEESLRFLGPEFKLAWREVRYHLERANGFSEARARYPSLRLPEVK